MSEMKNKVNLSAYKKEMKDVLERLVKTMPAYKELRFFVKCVINHCLTDFEKNNSDIVVIGSNIPEELVLVSGKMPYWILGGSRVSSMWADEIVPRDTDPVSRSGLGAIVSGFAENALILIPLVNDSTRKLAYILKSKGLKVHTFHFPPVKDAQTVLEWRRQYEACREAVALHLKRPLTKRVLQKSQEQISTAKKQIQDFMEVSKDTLNGTSRMFILGSYYCADNLSEWNFQLECLTARLRKEHKCRNTEKSKVLLLGSPIYFPNYKVPFLIEEVGLELLLQADYTTLSTQDCRLERMQKERMADIFYWNDASPAYVKNSSLYERIEKLLTQKEIDGVVYHVLKGQIEYDFELERFEELFEKMNIPVFRLETDYNYQDIEQLRIRLEAFSEILNQHRYRRQVTAKSLAEGINMVGNAQYKMSEFLKYRRHDLSLMSGTQVMSVMNAYSYMPVNLWAEQMHRLNEEMKLRLSQGRFVSRKNQPRVLVTGSPIAFPNIKVPLLIEEMGGVLAADETCMGERGLYDPVSVIDATFDGMMRSLASRYTKPCTCPVFVDNSQRIYRIKQMIKEHKIQGVIYHVLRGCLVYDYEYQLMEEAMGKMDIPIIRVESDYNEEDVEQLRIRIEAFIELIKMHTSA